MAWQCSGLTRRRDTFPTVIIVQSQWTPVHASQNDHVIINRRVWHVVTVTAVLSRLTLCQTTATLFSFFHHSIYVWLLKISGIFGTRSSRRPLSRQTTFVISLRPSLQTSGLKFLLPTRHRDPETLRIHMIGDFDSICHVWKP